MDMKPGMTPGRMVKVYRLGEASVPLGGLRFAINHRIVVINGEEDHGASIDVYAPIEGKETELIKFDCFVKSPHYHAPAKAKPHDIDTKSVGDGVDWVLGIIRSNMPEMLSLAGYMDLAKTLDRDVFAKHWTDVKNAVQTSKPASYDIPVNA